MRLRDAWDILRRARGPREWLYAMRPSLGGAIVLNSDVLNSEAHGAGRGASGLIQDLRSARAELKAHISEGRVAYDAVRASRAFERLVEATLGLPSVSPADLSKDVEKTAFFVNLYNVLAIHGVIALGLQESVMEVPSFFARVSYQVGEVCLSLDAIEHGLLRGNAPHPATGSQTLSRGNAALDFAPKETDPRIHMALVCAAQSCPPVGFYDPEALDRQLDSAARFYVNQHVQVSGKGVSLPVLFRYYADDWGGREGVESFLVEHAEPGLSRALRDAFEARARVRFQRYDWSLNRHI